MSFRDDALGKTPSLHVIGMRDDTYRSWSEQLAAAWGGGDAPHVVLRVDCAHELPFALINNMEVQTSVHQFLAQFSH